MLTRLQLRHILSGAGLLMLSGTLQAEDQLLEGLTGNVGFTNNYLWRGITQTQDAAAVYGGLDYSFSFFDALGLYAGLWFSNVDFGGPDDPQYELDLYGGVSGELFSVGYDVGYIWYAYPDDSANIDFGEVYAGLNWWWLSGTVYKTVNSESAGPDANAWYYEGALDVPLPGDVTASLHVGAYRGTGAAQLVAGATGLNGDSYYHYGASLSKNEFSIGFVDTDLSSSDGPDDLVLVVSFHKDFDL